MYKITKKCGMCGHETEPKYEEFLQLPLTLPEQSQRCSLLACINAFLQPSLCHGFNCPNPQCNMVSTTMKQTSFARLPPVLMIQLNRFSANGTKKENHVDFGINLDTRKFATHDLGHQRYRLRGVVKHTGVLNNGHYVASCFRETQSTWYNFDDALVTQINETEVCTKEAYVLFYHAVKIQEVKEEQGLPVNREEVEGEETAIPVDREKGKEVEDAMLVSRRQREQEEHELPPIITEMKVVIEEALSKRSWKKKILTKWRGTVSDLRTLSDLNWLNDQVINAYLELVCLRSKEVDKWPTVYAFSSFFYPKLMKDGHTAFKTWVGKKLFSHDLLLVPVHQNLHWCMAVVDLRVRSITYYDSKGGSNPKFLQKMRHYLTFTECSSLKRPPEGMLNLVVPKNIPQQENNSDCGVFACKFAEYVSRDAAFTFSQADMPYYRQRMVYELCKKKLIHP